MSRLGFDPTRWKWHGGIRAVVDAEKRYLIVLHDTQPRTWVLYDCRDGESATPVAKKDDGPGDPVWAELAEAAEQVDLGELSPLWATVEGAREAMKEHATKLGGAYREDLEESERNDG